MSPLEIVALVVGIPASVGTAVVALPAFWRFICLPGRIDDQLRQLDKLDGISSDVSEARTAAAEAARVAAEAHEEWKGATQVVTREISRMGEQLERHGRKFDDLDARVRRLEADERGDR